MTKKKRQNQPFPPNPNSSPFTLTTLSPPSQLDLGLWLTVRHDESLPVTRHGPQRAFGVLVIGPPAGYQKCGDNEDRL